MLDGLKKLLGKAVDVPSNAVGWATRTGYGESALHSPSQLAHHAANAINNDVIQAPGNALEKLAIATSGAHPLPVSQTILPYWLMNQRRTLQYKPRFIKQATLAQNGQPGFLPHVPQRQSSKPLPQPQRPSLRLISKAYGSLQPFEGDGGNYEDSSTAGSVLQPTGFSNQTSLNGQLTQGPMSSFYKLRGF